MAEQPRAALGGDAGQNCGCGEFGRKRQKVFLEAKKGGNYRQDKKPRCGVIMGLGPSVGKKAQIE